MVWLPQSLDQNIMESDRDYMKRLSLKTQAAPFLLFTALLCIKPLHGMIFFKVSSLTFSEDISLLSSHSMSNITTVKVLNLFFIVKTKEVY